MQRSDNPSIDQCDQRMLFAERQHVRIVGRLVVLLSLAAVAVVVSLPGVPSQSYVGVLIAAVVLTFLGGIAAGWTQTVLLDFKNSACISTRGPWIFARVYTEPLDTADNVLLRSDHPEGLEAADSIEYSLSITFPDKQVTLFNRRTDENTIDIAHTVADQLGRPLRVTDFHKESLEAPRSNWWASGVMWTAMLTVAGIMLWPVISGSRPIIARSGGGGRRGVFNISEMAPTDYDRGVHQYELGNYGQAEETFRNAHKDKPHDAEIVNMLAYSLAEQGKLDAALQAANEALKLSPLSGNIIDTVAEMHERRKEFAAAAVLYAKALEYMDIKDAGETNTKFGRTLIALGRNSEAKQHLLDANRFPSYRWDPIARRLLKQLDPNISLPRPMPPPPIMNMRGGPRMMPMMIRP